MVRILVRIHLPGPCLGRYSRNPWAAACPNSIEARLCGLCRFWGSAHRQPADQAPRRPAASPGRHRASVPCRQCTRSAQLHTLQGLAPSVEPCRFGACCRHPYDAEPGRQGWRRWAAGRQDLERKRGRGVEKGGPTSCDWLTPTHPARGLGPLAAMSQGTSPIPPTRLQYPCSLVR